MVAASDRDGIMFALSAGNCGDAPEGRALLQQLGPVDHSIYLLMDRAYEGDETRTLAMDLGYVPVVPPKSNHKNPWDYNKQLYQQRNQVERPGRKSCVKADKRQSKEREQLEGQPVLGTGRLNLAYPPVFRDRRRYARAA